MAAKNSIRFRAFSAGQRTWRLWRDGDKIVVEEGNSKKEFEFPTRSAARRAMDVPETICK